MRLGPGVMVRCSALGECVETAECSLPRLLFGHNGHLITDQTQVDAALNRFSDLLKDIAEIPNVRACCPSRLDLAWNFDQPAKPLIHAHAPLRLPGIRRGATVFNEGEGLSWRNARSQLVIRLYDKARKMRVQGSSVLRAEVSFRSREIARRFEYGKWWNFDEAYRVYRGVLSTIPPIKLSGARGWQEALGLQPFEIRQQMLADLGHKPQRTLRAWRQRVEAAATGRTEDFRWSVTLPLDGPPPPVHVEPLPEAKGP